MEKVLILIEEVAGKEAVPIAQEIIKGKENVSEFKLAETLNMNINQVRNFLYKLQKYNLITSTRKKDKKKGWYIYYWTFNVAQAIALSASLKKTRLSSLKKRLEAEENTEYYTCTRKCKKLDLEEAMELNFKCDECSNLLNRINNEKEIKAIQKEITLLEQDMMQGNTTTGLNQAAQTG